MWLLWRVDSYQRQNYDSTCSNEVEAKAVRRVPKSSKLRGSWTKPSLATTNLGANQLVQALTVQENYDGPAARWKNNPHPNFRIASYPNTSPRVNKRRTSFSFPDRRPQGQRALRLEHTAGTAPARINDLSVGTVRAALPLPTSDHAACPNSVQCAFRKRKPCVCCLRVSVHRP